MARIARSAGTLLCVLGLLLALFPFISVWRLSGEVLDELPSIPGSATTDDRNRLGAIFDDDFTLATRTYADVTVDQVREALADRAFEPTSNAC